MWRRYVRLVFPVTMWLPAEVDASQDNHSPCSDLESGSAPVFAAAPNVEQKLFTIDSRPQRYRYILSRRREWYHVIAQTMLLHSQ